MKTVIAIVTLALITMTGFASFTLFTQSYYYISALLTVISFLSVSLWINRISRVGLARH